MQIIDDMGAGGRLGATLGTGLQQLAQSKLNMLTQQHAEQKYNMQKSALEKHGIPSALGDLILSNPKLAQEIVPGLVAGGAFDIGQLPQETNIPQAAPVNQASAVQQLLSNAQQAPQQKISPLDMLNLLNSSGAGGLQIPQTMPKEISPQIQSLSPEQQTAQGIEKTANVEQRRKPTLSEALTKRAKEKEAFEERKMADKAWELTKDYREKVLDTEEKSQEALNAIKQAKKLEKSGDFPSQQFASFLEGAGWEDVPGFLSGDAEAYNKILANFQRGAKDIYGGRITNFEMEQFLKTIPNLQHTPEGRAQIWAMMENFYRGGKERAKLMRKIMAENKGMPTKDLHEKVNEQFKPIQKSLAKRFKKDLKKAEKLKGSSLDRFGSIASYGAGKVLGALPKTAAGAATGALAGSLIPGLGTGLGALAGGALGASGGISSLIKHLL